tara:strand:+ start:2354 stop:3754 length:1401 start_codon:yes stop_codon:yes gene_type:complete
MGYVGNSPTANFASVTKDEFSGDGSTTAFTLSKAATTNGVAVFVENVRQEPTTAYAVSGTTLTFTAAPVSASGNNIYVLHHNAPASTANHPAGQDLTAVKGTFTSTVDITDTTDASDATGDTGALRTEGGASIAKKLYVGTDLDVDGTANLDVVDIDGALTQDGGNVVFNESSADVDFRVESNADDHAFFVNGGDDSISMGTSSNSVGGAPNSATGQLNILHSTSGRYVLQLRGDHTGSNGIFLRAGSSTSEDIVRFTQSDENNPCHVINGKGQFTVTAYENGNTIGSFINGQDTPYGIAVSFSNQSPDNNTNWFFRAQDSTTSRFTVFSDGDVATADAGFLTSDIKNKHTISNATDKWEDVKKLQVRNFYWKEDYHPDKKDKKMIGFIAQEFEEVFPALVQDHKDTDLVDEKNDDGVVQQVVKDLGTTTKHIKEGKLIPILTKALQEAMARIETLEAKVKALEEA